MSGSSSLTLLWTPWTLVLSICIWTATAVVSYFAWRRSGYRPAIAALEIVRLAVIALVAFLLNQPEWVEEFRREGKPKIAVLVDGSKSLETADAAADSSAKGVNVTRAAAIEPLLKKETWRGLEERFDVVVETICKPEDGNGSNLSAPLLNVADNVNDLVGVVLVSDGDWNQGVPPIDAANHLRLKNIPVVSMPVGSSMRLPDVELTEISAPSIAIAGKDVRIPLTIDSSLPREFMATVKLTSSDGDVRTSEIRVNPNGRTEGSILYRPSTVGTYQISVEVPVQNDEVMAENNKATASIVVREERIKVLIVESTPRWEYRYLRNALSRDPGVEVSCLLFQTGMTKFGGGNKDYLKEFPATKEELSEYDVVFLGDVGLEGGQLTQEQCEWIAGLVEHQASGLVFLPGFRGNQFSLLDTNLQKLYPVVPDETQPQGVGSNTAGQLELTEAGRKSLLTKLGATDEENFSIWENLPGFNWHAPVLRAKAGTETLCVHQSDTNDFGRLPLLVSQTFGAGKVLFMGTDGAWKWRYGVEDKYHYRFWGQVVRWMAYQRNMAEGESMRLYYTPDAPAVRQTIAMQANVLGPSGDPLTEGDVVANITAPSGKSSTVRFTSAGNEWGSFSGNFSPTEGGDYKVVLSCRQTGASLTSSIFVRDEPLEVVGRPARPEVLEEIASVTNGAVLQPTEVTKVVNYLSDLPEPPPTVRRLQMWSHPLTVVILVGALGVFWVGRKAVGLV